MPGIGYGVKYHLPDHQTPFQRELYIHLINWKWQHITREPGVDRSGIPYDVILPDTHRDQLPFLYPAAVAAVRELQGQFPFRAHIYFNHMGSSQAAAFNLFLPILLHPKCAEVLRAVRPDFARLATERLYRGFCVEYWDGVEEEKKRMDRGELYKGLLNDKSPCAGTDADIAIAYYNPQDELCLWLIEHKLTEAEFTTCGGSRSRGRQPHHDCGRSFAEILADKRHCYHHDRRGSRYWEITEANREFFVHHDLYSGCPFQGGLNQLCVTSSWA